MTSDSQVGRGQASEVCGGGGGGGVGWPGIQTTNIGRGDTPGRQHRHHCKVSTLQVPVSTELDSEPTTATISLSLHHISRRTEM